MRAVELVECLVVPFAGGVGVAPTVFVALGFESSGEVHACFARQYTRFTFGRPEDTDIDGCTLESLRARLVAGEPLSEVMKSVAMRPEFRRRLIRQEDNP